LPKSRLQLSHPISFQNLRGGGFAFCFPYALTRLIVSSIVNSFFYIFNLCIGAFPGYCRLCSKGVQRWRLYCLRSLCSIFWSTFTASRLHRPDCGVPVTGKSYERRVCHSGPFIHLDFSCLFVGSAYCNRFLNVLLFRLCPGVEPPFLEFPASPPTHFEQ